MDTFTIFDSVALVEVIHERGMASMCVWVDVFRLVELICVVPYYVERIMLRILTLFSHDYARSHSNIFRFFSDCASNRTENFQIRQI